MRLLRQTIRQILIKEALKFDEDIMILPVQYETGIWYLLATVPPESFHFATPENYEGQNEYKFYKEHIKGMVNLANPGKKTRCYDAKMVKQAAARSGWGPTLYDLVMELEPNGIINDRSSVTSPMKDMMMYYNQKRPSVSKKLLDNKLDRYTYPRTPELEDDCYAGDGGEYEDGISVYGFGKKWEEDPLSYAYDKPLTARTQEIAREGEEFRRAQGSALSNEMITDMADELFNTLY